MLLQGTINTNKTNLLVDKYNELINNRVKAKNILVILLNSYKKNEFIKKIKEVQKAGDIVGIAHPFRVGYPVCTGGRNQFPKEIFSVLDFYEVISGEVEEVTNERSVAEYKKLRKDGYVISATYGRDWHGNNDKKALPTVLRTL